MACKQPVSRTLQLLGGYIQQQEQHHQTREIFGNKGVSGDDRSNAVLVDLYDEDLHKDLQKAYEILRHYSIHIQGVETGDNSTVEGSCLSDEKTKD